MHEASFRRGRRRHRRSIAKHTHKNTHNCWQPTQIRKSYKRHTINKAHTHTAKRPLSITIASHGQLFQTLSPVQNQQLIFSVFFFDSNFVAFFLFFFCYKFFSPCCLFFLAVIFKHCFSISCDCSFCCIFRLVLRIFHFLLWQKFNWKSDERSTAGRMK